MSTNPNSPNIDQRIEALTQSLELLSHIMQENERKFNERFDKLLRIVESHERRISGLEGWPGRRTRRSPIDKAPSCLTLRSARRSARAAGSRPQPDHAAAVASRAGARARSGAPSR
jgi:hypothetical protein